MSASRKDKNASASVVLGRHGGIGGGRGRNGNGFRRVVLSEFRSEVGREDGSLGCSGGRKLLYGTDMVIGGLRGRGQGSRISLGSCRTRKDAVPLALACKSSVP